MAVINVCSHCGEITSRSKDSKRKFCGDCNTSAKRKEMDENNKKIWADNGMKEYHCKFCEGEK